MKIRDVVKMLNDDGWYEDRQKGSHKMFKHEEKPGIVVVPDHGAKDLAIGTLRSIHKQAGLDHLLRK